MSPEGVTAGQRHPADRQADADSVPDDAWITYVINPDGDNINATTLRRLQAQSEHDARPGSRLGARCERAWWNVDGAPDSGAPSRPPSP